MTGSKKDPSKPSNTETLSAFAARLDCNKSHVTRLKQRGRLVMTADGKVDVAASLKRIEETKGRGRPDVADRHQREREEPRAPEPPEGGESSGDPSDPNTRAYWDRREAAAKAKLKEIELATTRGELVSREDVDFVLNDFGATWRGLLDNLADRLAPTVYPLDSLEETHAAITEAAEELQEEMAATMKRRIEGIGKT